MHMTPALCLVLALAFEAVDVAVSAQPPVGRSLSGLTSEEAPPDPPGYKYLGIHSLGGELVHLYKNPDTGELHTVPVSTVQAVDEDPGTRVPPTTRPTKRNRAARG